MKSKGKSKFKENQGNSTCKQHENQALPKAHKRVKKIDLENESSV